jgi:hypothetical protein
VFVHHYCREQADGGNNCHEDARAYEVEHIIGEEGTDRTAKVICRIVVRIDETAWPVGDIEAQATAKQDEQADQSKENSGNYI